MWNPFKKPKPSSLPEVGDLLGDEIIIEAQPTMDLEKGWWTKVTTETIEGKQHVYESWVDNHKNKRIYRKSKHYNPTYNAETDSKFKVFKK